MLTNSFYELETKQETKKTRKAPNARPSKPTTTESPTTQPKQPKALQKAKRPRLTREERKARARERAAENRRKLKALGLCKDCRQAAIPGQVRCVDCADKHCHRSLT